MNIKKDIFWRVYLSFAVILIAAVAIMAQVFTIQHVEGDHWRAKADSISTRFKTIEPVRGNILSSDGRLMAASMPVYEIRMDPNADGLSDEVFYDKVDSLAYHLGEYFGDKSASEYRDKLVKGRRNGERYMLIQRSINHHQLKQVQDFPLFRRGQYKGGFIVEQRTARVNPFRKLARRTVGYQTEHLRPVGLEGGFNEYLSGTEGKRLMQRVAGGTWIPINDENELEPEDGKDLVTTIDINIQDVTKQALLEQLTENNARHGSAVVMEVNTGKIKAIANLKASEENGEYREFYNYAVGESTEPGSTFKLASILSLLEKAGVSPSDSIETGDGKKDFYDRTMEDHHPGGLGTITFKDAFARSSNVGISKLIQEHFGNNPSDFTNYLRELNLDRQLGLPIAGEGSPVVKSPTDDDWSGTTLPWMSIGYEVKLTPLQLLTFFNAVANDGEMVKPLFVDHIRDVGRIYRDFNKEVINSQIASPTAIEEAGEMLRATVDDGTASNLKTDNYSIAGKTGTALIASPEGYGEAQDKVYQSSFVGYFPAENPQYSIAVVVNDPSEGRFYGADVAGPVFREISDKIFANNLELHKALEEDRKEENKHTLPPGNLTPGNRENITELLQMMDFDFENQTNAQWAKAKREGEAMVVRGQDVEGNTIPDVRGMVVSDAIYLLENLGLEVETRGTGRVVSQSVLPGTRATEGRRIVLTLN